MRKYREGRDRHVAKAHAIAKAILVTRMTRNIQTSFGQAPDQSDFSFEVSSEVSVCSEQEFGLCDLEFPSS